MGTTQFERVEPNQGVEGFVKGLLKQPGMTVREAINHAEGAIGELDLAITERVQKVLHHKKFQALESSWRGLEHLVRNSRPDGESLIIRFYDLSHRELEKMMRRYRGAAWDRSPFFQLVYEAEYGVAGGKPYGCLIGDYEFSHRTKDTITLEQVARTCAAAHVPFIAGASADLAQMESWRELANPVDLPRRFKGPEYAPWRSLRDQEDSRYLGLTVPRVLARLPYGALANPVHEFDLEEDTDGPDHGNFLWMNASFCFGTVINRAFMAYGWCAKIRGLEGGGIVDDLWVHPFRTDDSREDLRCATETAITARREAELSSQGLIPLCHLRNSEFSVFRSAQSLHRPRAYSEEDATRNAELGGRLPYIFGVARFAHFIKVMVRDKIGGYSTADELQDWLHNWVQSYCMSDPKASEDARAERPLHSAQVAVRESADAPGQFEAVFHLRPHFQLEGLNGWIDLDTRLPGQADG